MGLESDSGDIRLCGRVKLGYQVAHPDFRAG